MKPIPLAFLTLLAVSAVAPLASSRPPKSPAARVAGDIAAELDAIDTLLLTGGAARARSVEARLRSMENAAMDVKTRAVWVRLSRDAALRLGDAAWLAALAKHPKLAIKNPANWSVRAYAELAGNNFPAAETALEAGGKPDSMNARDIRRYHAVKAKLAQLQNRPQGERASVEQLLSHLPEWPTPSCQSCHAPNEDPNAKTYLPIARLWFVQRYVEILRRDGDAAAVQKIADETLAADPTDTRAKLSRALAQWALGDETGSAKTLAEIPFTPAPNRKLARPRIVISFP